MAQIKDLPKLYALLEIITRIRVKEFPLKNINIVSIPGKMVITPMDKLKVWGDQSREIHVVLGEIEQKIKIYGFKSSDTPARKFAERIAENIKKDEYFNTSYSVELIPNQSGF